jgi:hypothetical protein
LWQTALALDRRTIELAGLLEIGRSLVALKLQPLQLDLGRPQIDLALRQ